MQISIYLCFCTSATRVKVSVSNLSKHILNIENKQRLKQQHSHWDQYLAWNEMARAEQYLQDDEGLSKWNERKASFASIASASQIAAAAAAISVFGTFL